MEGATSDAVLDALGDTAIPDTSDDPAVWFPELFDREGAVVGSGFADLVSATEDIRSFAYRSMVERASQPRRDVGAGEPTVRVCRSTVDQPDDRHMSFAFAIDDDSGTRLGAGVFRRSMNGTWLWLGSAVAMNSVLLAACVGGSDG